MLDHFLSPDFHPQISKATTVQELLVPEHQLEALAVLTVRKLDQCVRGLEEEAARGLSSSEAWNLHMSNLVDMVQFHIYHYILESFLEAINESEQPEVKQVLVDLCSTFSLKFFASEASHLLETAVLLPTQLPLIRKAQIDQYAALRPNIAAIVDALDVPDIVLASALGRYDGDIYRAYLDAMASCKESSTVIPYWNILPSARL